MKLNKRKLKKAKSIYVRSDFLLEFLADWGKFVKAKVLVSGGSDTNFNESLSLPPSVQLLLLQNSSISNNAIIKTLPIGLEDLHLGRSGLKKYHKHTDAVTNVRKIWVPPMSNTNPIRRPMIIECMNRPEIFDISIGLMHEEEYYRMSKNYRFILCLEGNGYENHRIWETLYQGSFPVLLKTRWSKSLEYLNLPLLLIDSIGEVSTEVLDEFYIINKGFSAKDKENLWIPYWQRLVLSNSE